MSNVNKFSRAFPRPFGAANWVTSVRAIYSLLLLGYSLSALWQGIEPATPLRWYWVVCGLGALALDGIDGMLARRLGAVSRFGARFDMETDAALVLGLSLLVIASGQAGIWVLVSGALRYMFIAGGWFWPVLAAPLPYRRRRQVVCVGQILALLLAVAPPIPPAAAGAICATALAVLVGSFAVDAAWLIANRVEADDSEVVI